MHRARLIWHCGDYEKGSKMNSIQRILVSWNSYDILVKRCASKPGGYPVQIVSYTGSTS